MNKNAIRINPSQYFFNALYSIGNGSWDKMHNIDVFHIQVLELPICDAVIKNLDNMTKDVPET